MALNLQLSLKKGSKQKTLEPKYIFNLAQFEKESMGAPKLAIVVILIVAVVALVGKFGVLDRFNALHQKEAEAEQMQQKLTDIRAEIAELQGVTDEYAHYTMDGMEEEETSLVNRDDVMNLINKYILPYASVGSWKLNGNTLVLTISNTSLSRVNRIVTDFNMQDIVNYCFVQTAATETTEIKDLTAQLTAYLQNPVDEEPVEEPAAEESEEVTES